MYFRQAVSLTFVPMGLALIALSSCVPAEDGPAPAPAPLEEASVTASAAVAAAATGAMALSESPVDALSELKAASMKGPVAVFKHSQICPISGAAHGRFNEWMKEEGAEEQVKFAHIDVIDEKPLARGLVAELGIKHESPQLLLFHQGEVVWHASHAAITGEALTAQLALLD